MKKAISRLIGYMFLAGMTTILIQACKKRDSPYHNYQVAQTETYDGTVLQYLESQKGVYDSMVVVIRRYPELVSKLSSPGNMTIFAIPNEAFEVAEKNFNLEQYRKDSPYLYFKPRTYDLSRSDSGMFHYETLETLISRYIFDSVYSYEYLATSSSGFPVSSVLGYTMNLKAIQQNAAGSLKDGPKAIELSDMNNSIFRRFWKSVNTSSIAAVQTSNALVHVLTQNHEFGFASFTQRLQDPTIERSGWTPIAWSSQYTGAWGGTVLHALDNNLNTRWHTLTIPPPPPPFFTVDMKRNTLIGGVTIQVRTDGSHDGSPVDFYLEFAPDGTKNLADSSSWIKMRFNYPPDPATVKLPKRFNFPQKVLARYFRFTVIQVFSGRLYTDRFYSNLDEIWMNY